MRTAADFVPGATSGNATSVDIAATPEVVWASLHAVEMSELRASGLLLGIRSIPAKLKQRRLGGGRSGETATDAGPMSLLTAMSGRFVTLASVEHELITLGLIGQFWKLSGGADVRVADAGAFLDFADSGFVKASIDFRLEANGSGTRLVTSTHNIATDPETAKKFRRYWLFIGPGSKLIRFDMLRAIRRHAERQ